MSVYQEITKRLERGPLYLYTIVTGQHTGEKMIAQNEEQVSFDCQVPGGLELSAEFWREAAQVSDLSGCPCQFAVQGETVFVERLVEEPEVVVCGGGHISQEIGTLLSYLEYPYTVIDDREEFTRRERFVNARGCICAPFETALREGRFSGNAYYVIVTRGHAADMQCLEVILKQPFGYVGMIGSRGKVRKTMDALLEKGYDKALLSCVHAPIGIEIGGQTPKEIAVSIIAQLIQVKNKEQVGSYLEPDMKELLSKGKQMVLARIIAKRGSAPRGVGSRMLVDKNGILCGTIGGGIVEYHAIKRAKELAETGGSVVESYCLSSESAASIGMWCGGDVDVLFESV